MNCPKMSRLLIRAVVFLSPCCFEFLADYAKRLASGTTGLAREESCKEIKVKSMQKSYRIDKVAGRDWLMDFPDQHI